VSLFSKDGGDGARSTETRVKLRRRAILAVADRDAPGVVALQRAYVLSQIFDARLFVVHALPNGAQPLVEHEDAVRSAVVEWAAATAKVALAPQDVEVDVGHPARAVERAARAVGAELIVVGAPHTLDEDGSAGSEDRLANTIADLAGSLSRGLLVAHPPRTRCELVAATDLRDARFPVVKTAAQLADALSARVTVVHNLEQDGPVLSLALETVAGRLQVLERLASELDGVRGGHVSTTRTTAEAIADVARSRDADIAVVGIRRGHGRTLLSLLGRTRCSVLAIPLAMNAAADG